MKPLILCVSLCFCISTFDSVCVKKDQNSDQSSSKPLHRNMNKVKRLAVANVTCAERPPYNGPYRGVNWDYTEAGIEETNKTDVQASRNLIALKFDLATHINAWPHQRCFYLKGSHLEYRDARVPGFYCKDDTSVKYNANYRRQMICGNAAYFIYYLIEKDTGCPIADLLEDCKNPDLQPVKVAGEPIGVAAPEATSAFADPSDPCVGDFFGLVIQIYESDTSGKRSFPFKSKSRSFGRFTVAEVESNVCLPQTPSTGRPQIPTVPKCAASLNPSKTYSDVHWSYTNSLVSNDQRLTSNDYKSARSINSTFQYNKLYNEQVPYCTNTKPELQSVDNVAKVRGYDLNLRCIIFKGDSTKGIDGRWVQQFICGSSAYFHVFVKHSTGDPKCSLGVLLQHCRTASINGRHFTALVPSQHAVYQDPDDPCPNDYFGLKVEIYEIVANPSNTNQPKSVIYAPPESNGRLTLGQIERDVYWKK